MKLIPKNAKSFVRYKNQGFMDLTIDILSKTDDKTMIAMAHYAYQNGDAMADPDMEIILDHETQTTIPVHYQNDFVGVYERSETDKQKLESNSFLSTWLDNIIKQCYKISQIDLD